jgi:hypothetical protein
MDKTLEQQLLCLARYVRDPSGSVPPPGIEPRRLAIYRQLFYGNIEALLAAGFPVLCASIGAEHWQRLVQDFYANYRCQTPLFTELGAEFVLYLEQGAAQRLKLPLWLAELAHYERVESELLLRDAPQFAVVTEVSPVAAVLDAADLLDAVPMLSTLAWPLAYQWPVCDIGPDYLPEQSLQQPLMQPLTQPLAQPTLLLAQRKADFKVYFSRLAPLVYALLVSIEQQQWSARQHLAALAQMMGVELAALLPQGTKLLEQLRQQGVITF